MRVAAHRILGVAEFLATGDIFDAEDPLLGYSLRPGSSRIVAKGGAFLVKERINEHGLRDVNHSYEKDSGIERILVLGDSFMYGEGVTLEATMARQLAILRPDWEVVNAGVRGYDVGQYYLYY